ncbi:hypothetical protein FOL47_006878 [Perkinsus chesapeaki]|uniref:Uncharacterized protein n=1 Tax=Perkinsus chesapeaki TaxID=330153 RepID=A0A7J6LP87_PERCH|nr:hypothetical protein FOL47_006878 [Perkinsus chesapeaki]
MKRSSDTPESAAESSPEKRAREEQAPPVAGNSGPLFVEDTEGSAPEQETAPERSSPQASPAPPQGAVTEEQPLCRFFVKGMCRNGSSCPFRHDYKAVVCTYFLHGNCRNGSSCRFSHHLPESAPNSQGGPPPDVCKFFWHGSCRAGNNCKWRHVKAPSTLSAAPRPVLPVKSDPAVTERAKALLQRHSISRVAQESGATEFPTMGNNFCSKGKPGSDSDPSPPPPDGSQHLDIRSTISDTVAATAGTSLPPAPVTIDVGSPISERDSSPSGAAVGVSDDKEEEEHRITVQKASGRRAGVSAEACTVERMDSWRAPMYHKTPEEIEAIKKMMASDESGKRQILFGHLRERDIEKVVMAMRRRDVTKGECVIQQGNFGDAFYIVDEGTFDIYVKRGDKEPVKVMECGPGSSFGELALMYNAPRAATVTATSDAKLWCLDRDCFQLMVVTSENIKKKEYEGFLEKVPILADLNKFELSQLSDMLTSEVFKKGEVIVTQGDTTGDNFYVLEDGECTAFMSGEEGEVEVKKYTTPGEYFGEIALLKPGEPRKATIKAGDDGCRVLSVDREAFSRVLGPITDVLRKNASMPRSRSRSSASSRRGKSGSRSGSRSGSSRSRSSSLSSKASDPGAEGLSVIKVKSDEAALVLGRGGSTKRKLENAADCDIELVNTEGGDSNVELRGPARNRELGRDYICFLLLNKKNEPLDLDPEERDDCSWIDVPQDTIGYVTGRERSTLHALEEETETLMFFQDKDVGGDAGPRVRGRSDEIEKLIILGPTRGRRIAQLKLMSAIESKSPGFFLDHRERWNLDDTHGGKLGLTTVKMTEAQFTYALGRRGATRKKLERASGAIIEYIGYTAFISGSKPERRRGRDYLNFLLDQREGEVNVKLEGREDVTAVETPEEYIGFITGHKGSELRSIEERTGTFCFVDGCDQSFVRSDGPWWGKGKGGWGSRGKGKGYSSWRDDRERARRRPRDGPPPRLLIFCYDSRRRDDAEEMVRGRIHRKIEQDKERGKGGIHRPFLNRHSNPEIETKRRERLGLPSIEEEDAMLAKQKEEQEAREREEREARAAREAEAARRSRSGSRRRSRSGDDRSPRERKRRRSRSGGRSMSRSGDRSISRDRSVRKDDRARSPASVDKDSPRRRSDEKSPSKNGKVDEGSDVEPMSPPKRDRSESPRDSSRRRRSRSRSGDRRRSRSRSESERRSKMIALVVVKAATPVRGPPPVIDPAGLEEIEAIRETVAGDKECHAAAAAPCAGLYLPLGLPSNVMIRHKSYIFPKE